MRTVLIADDSAFMREWIKRLIEKSNYTVIGEAINGLDAVMQYQKLRPNIVILDIIMPKSNGLDALAKIMELNPKANVIIASSLATRDNIIRAIQLGAKDFIIKPHFNGLVNILNSIDS